MNLYSRIYLTIFAALRAPFVFFQLAGTLPALAEGDRASLIYEIKLMPTASGRFRIEERLAHEMP